MFFTAFQPNAFQNNAFQIGGLEATGKGGGEYLYVHPFQLARIEDEKRAKLKKQKTELEKLDSVVAFNRDRAAIAAKNKLLAKTERAVELAKIEQDHLIEIARLLMVRDGLIRQIQLAEQAIIAVVVMRKRRLRIASSLAS